VLIVCLKILPSRLSINSSLRAVQPVRWSFHPQWPFFRPP
jgi:hypothetical protein